MFFNLVSFKMASYNKNTATGKKISFLFAITACNSNNIPFTWQGF